MAEIKHLETCPFCEFATIMPNQNDKIFRCFNPECFKDSCRFCKKLNHLPMTCEEAKILSHSQNHIENEMSEAIIRKCFHCKKRFIKGDGCNKMVCSCGAQMCYFCQMPITGYEHFSEKQFLDYKDEKGKCPLWSNSDKLHEREAKERANRAI